MEIMLYTDEIEKILPHRYENFLIDSEKVFVNEGINNGRLSLLVNKPDPRNRDIFFAASDRGNNMLEPIYMEIAALCAIISMGTLPDGIVAFFSAITNFKKQRDIALGQLLIAETEQGRSKGDFYRFNGRILDSSNNIIAEGNLMAFAMNVNAGIQESEKKKAELPTRTCNEQIDKTAVGWKRPAMVFADRIVDCSKTGIVTEYVYPSDHPFTKGHFPGNPVMMGVSLWLAAADSMWFYAKKLNIQDVEKLNLVGDIEILKDNGVVATEIKDCSCLIWYKNNQPDFMEIVSTKKLYFRDVVKPGDKLLIKTTITSKQ